MHKINIKIGVLLLLIVSLGVIVRFYKLTDFPVQLNHDEVTQIYDAISIAQTGKDVYGNSYPLMFKSVNDYKSPFYTYTTSVFYLMFGGGELIIRLPAAIFGSLIVIGVFVFTKALFKTNNISLISAFITAISPFEIFFSRKSFENQAGIFFMLIGFSFLLSYLEKNKFLKLFFGSLFLSIAMYTYFSHAIIIPLLLISFLFIFKQEFWQLKKVIFPLVFFILMVLPIIVIVFTNSGARYRTATVFLTQDSVLGELVNLTQANHKLLSQFFKGLTIANYGFDRYLDQINPIYLFANGLDMTNQGPIGMGPLLLIQFPFLIFGIFHLLKDANLLKQKNFIASWVILGVLPSGLTFEPHSPHRMIMVFTMLNIISGVGFYAFYNWLAIRKRVRNMAVFLIFFLSLLNEVYFFHIYFVNYPYEKSESIHYPFKQVSQYIWSQYSNFNTIIFDPLFGHSYPIIGTGAHYYLAYYGNYPPEKFQKEYRIGNKEREVIFDKFSIRRFDWLKDKDLQNTLVVASDWELPLRNTDKGRVLNIDPAKILKIFYYYNGEPAFYAIKL